MLVLSHGLGVSTFPWGRVTDTREKESPLAILRSEDRGPANYPSLGVREITVLATRIYDKVTEIPKSDEEGGANDTHAQMGCPPSTMNRGVSISLIPRMSANHEIAVTPLNGKTCKVFV
ncbi:hypothetical protein CRG98_018781 [Punica granatum]|uniref:Uncharacterized protein n=1 Tax=Punica granatum TaxID=22663 RepID=A0A2I0JX13_PUNGR|nr:hypothetical protein CRG98_018781 [Punica granatum]